VTVPEAMVLFPFVSRKPTWLAVRDMTCQSPVFSYLL
jgi:hypothetical protein